MTPRTSCSLCSGPLMRTVNPDQPAVTLAKLCPKCDRMPCPTCGDPEVTGRMVNCQTCGATMTAHVPTDEKQAP